MSEGAAAAPSMCNNLLLCLPNTSFFSVKLFRLLHSFYLTLKPLCLLLGREGAKKGVVKTDEEGNEVMAGDSLISASECMVRFLLASSSLSL